MAWSESVSRKRIREFKNSAPKSEILVEDFSEYSRGRQAYLAEARVRDPSVRTDPILNLKYNQAVKTTGVHIYARLVDFNDKLVEEDRETEASHKRALEFLHLHYGACDQLIREFEIQRVDFHGQRLHAVVLTPEGAGNERARALKAVAFANAFIELVNRQSKLYNGEFETDVCIGLESGQAVAINSGRSPEQEPLFIGRPANYAAKLAERDSTGIQLGDQIKIDLRNPSTLRILNEGDLAKRYIEQANAFEGRDGMPYGAVLREAANEYFNEVKKRADNQIRPANFVFYAHKTPLKSIDYSKHLPSNSIRMGMASVFADIDGFTNYIDKAISSGTVSEAVFNLHVIRRELNASLRDDFGGKKVRFIGDCIHAVISEGDCNADTAEGALKVAGGLRSSFQVLMQELDNVVDIEGLAIGLEIGRTPISRIGLSGKESVRCSASKATCVAEDEQKRCDGTETAIGEAIYSALPVRVSRNFGANRKLSSFDYDYAEVLLQGALTSSSSSPSGSPLRAHSV